MVATEVVYPCVYRLVIEPFAGITILTEDRGAGDEPENPRGVHIGLEGFWIAAVGGPCATGVPAKSGNRDVAGQRPDGDEDCGECRHDDGAVTPSPRARGTDQWVEAAHARDVDALGCASQ